MSFHPNIAKDYLWLQLRDLPYFRGVLRAVESRFYQDYELPSPVLDIGCGDGHFATITFDKKLDVGIDPWADPLVQAAGRGGYKLVLQGFGDKLPFPDDHFASALSNSVLEHIPDLDPVLAEINRVLRPGGVFLFCVPNHQFLPNLSVSNLFDRVGLNSLGNAYRRFFNRIARHHHCDDEKTWADRLAKAGFKVEKWWHYFSPQALHVLEWGHYFGLPSWVAHALFGKWILVRERWNLAITRAVVQNAYDENPYQPEGTCTFYVARKV